MSEGNAAQVPITPVFSTSTSQPIWPAEQDQIVNGALCPQKYLVRWLGFWLILHVPSTDEEESAGTDWGIRCWASALISKGVAARPPTSR